MRALNILLMLGIAISLISCTSNNDTSQNRHDANFDMISTSNAMDQSTANQAKKRINRRASVTEVHAVNTDKKLIIAFEIEHKKRFQLADIEKKVQKNMQKAFSDHKAEVSTDKKLVLEIDELEEKINQNEISNKKLKKEVDRLIKLMKEKT
ncbi:YhcN/YlaJ family sporulation lipoprotein [Lentibacillus salicampi]|uniref:Sporulation protein n=1 Tax=Lentibacillus salicampi TaxID=175306 RepID=A0A4Y9AJ67_9BACI|nr:YhcN/YlaJ family sporulation lipoprotein [Lentibacillus salicampi]TFJ94474.1 hypothetical protein E4U82_00720 [Lentibacillus salicampi]